MEDPPGSPPSSGHASLPPPPPPPVPPPPPRHSFARRRRTLFSFGSLPYQLVPRMPRPIPPHAIRPPKVMLQDDAPRASYSTERPKVMLLDDAPPASDSSERVGGFKMLSLDDAPTASDSSEWRDGNKDNEESFGEGDSDTCKYSSADDSDEDGECPFGNPYLRDSYGNLTNWRLSDLGAAFTKHLEDEAKNPKPKERKYTKEEKLKIHSDRMEGYMKVALHHYNNKEELVGDMKFEFEKAQSQNWIVEGKFDNLFYYHFNFEAKQAHSSVFTFFAEVTPEDGDDCDIICCKLLNDDDNGHCFGCKNEGVDDLRHPACESVYVGGHEDRKFPFMENSETEDDSD